MTTVKDRLRSALKLRQISIRRFQRIMANTDAYGTSYPAIHRYLGGEVEPSLSFLREAADILEVRHAWLMAGDGPMVGGMAAQARLPFPMELYTTDPYTGNRISLKLIEQPPTKRPTR